MGYKVFPTKFIRECIETYIYLHGKIPKILCVNETDMRDYIVTNTLGEIKYLYDIAPDLKIIINEDLPIGSIDLAIDIDEK